MTACGFSSALAPYFERFVALKRACGAEYARGAVLLRTFDRFLAASRKRRIDQAVISEFVASVDHLGVRTRISRFSVAWQALEHARRHGAPIINLPPRPRLRAPRTRPYVLTDDELDRFLRAAADPSWFGICPATYAAIFGLLAVTGMRIGEAVAIDVNDVDFENEVVLVRCGKFRKARLLPVANSTLAAIRNYLQERRRFGHSGSPDAPLFVSRRGTRFLDAGVRTAFKHIVARAGIGTEGRRPRVHDLRHTFAIRRVVAWHREGRDVNQLLRLLSTYLGHVGVRSTQVYLQPTLELLTTASDRFEFGCASAVSGRRKSGA